MIRSFRINEENTGRVSYPQISCDKDHSAFHIGGLIWSSPVISICGQFAYFGSSNRKFVCIKINTNELIWSYSLPNIRDNSLIDSTAAMSPCGKIVVIPGGDGALHALDAFTGNVLWHFCVSANGKHLTGGYDEMINEPVSGVTVPSFEGNAKFMRGDNVIAGCDNGFVYSVDAETGKQNWSFNAGLMIWGVACIVESRYILIGGLNGVIYLLDDNENGQLVAKYKCKGDIKGSIAYIKDTQEFFIGTSTGILYCFKLDINQKKINKQWSVDTGSEIYSSPALYKDYVFSANMFGNISAFNKTSGELAWKTRTFNSISSSPCISEDGLLYIGTSGGRLIVLYATTGTIKSIFTLYKGKVFNNKDKISLKNEKHVALNSSPVLLNNGICMIGSYDGYMYMVNTSKLQNDIDICPYDQTATHFELTSSRCSNIILLTLRATKPNTNIFEDITIIKKVTNCIVTDQNGNDYTGAFKPVISANANSVILVPTSRWVEYVSTYSPSLLNLNISVDFKCIPLVRDKWIDRYYSIKHGKRQFTQNLDIPICKDNIGGHGLYESAYDVRNGSCTDPIILDTYIPAAFDSLGYVMHFIKDQTRKLKWILLIPSIPDDQGNTIVRDQKRIILLEITNLSGGMFTAINKEEVLLSLMGGTFPLYDIAISGRYDAKNNRFNISMYSNSNCLGIRCNGTTYQFSERVVNQLCDKNGNSHIVTTFYAYPREKTIIESASETPMCIWVHKGAGVYDVKIQDKKNIYLQANDDCASELFIDLDREENIKDSAIIQRGCKGYKRDVTGISLNSLVSVSTFKSLKYLGVFLIILANVLFIYRPAMYVFVILLLILRTLIDSSYIYYDKDSFRLGNIYDNMGLMLYAYTILTLIVYILFTPDNLLFAYVIGFVLVSIFLVIRIYFMNSLKGFKRVYKNNSILIEGIISTATVIYAARVRGGWR